MSSSKDAEAAPRRRFRPGLLLTLLSAGLFVTLCALGTWQMQRLAWKTDLIASMEAGFAAPPRPLAGFDRSTPPEPFARVLVEGVWETGPAHFLGVEGRQGEVGAKLLGVLRDAAGRRWLVDRGWVPARLMAAARGGGFTGEAPVRFEAMARPALGRGAFTPADDAATGRVFAEDGLLAADPALMPRILVASSPAPPQEGGFPQPTPLRIDVKNDHLGYALTWYGLAASLLVFYVLMGFQRGAGEPP